jgi:glutathione S-transferase
VIADDGSSIFDSLVICEYFAMIADASWMFGSDRRIEVLIRHATAQAMLDMLLKRLSERNRGKGVENDLCGAYRTKVGWGLDRLETNAKGWMGEQFEVAQIAAACVLGYIDFRFAADDWRKDRPRLSEWFLKISERPSMRATVFKG